MSTKPRFSAVDGSGSAYATARRTLGLLHVTLLALLALPGAGSAQFPASARAADATPQTVCGNEAADGEKTDGEKTDADVLRRLVSCGGTQIHPSPVSGLQTVALTAYVESLSSDEAATILARTGLTDPETTAAYELARQQNSNQSGVWSGTYEDNAFKNAFRTLTAPILAPRLMLRRRIAYTYPLKRLLSNGEPRAPSDLSDLRNMILRGEVGLAQYNEQDQTYTLALPDSDIWRSNVSNCVACHNTEGGGSDHEALHVIAAQSPLLGRGSEGRATAWDAARPLNGAVLDGYRGVATAPVTEALMDAFRLAVGSTNNVTSADDQVAAPDPKAARPRDP